MITCDDQIKELLDNSSTIELTRFHSIKSGIFTTDKIVDLLSKYIVRPVEYKKLDGDLHYMTYSILDVRATDGYSQVCGHGKG